MKPKFAASLPVLALALLLLAPAMAGFGFAYLDVREKGEVRELIAAEAFQLSIGLKPTLLFLVPALIAIGVAARRRGLAAWKGALAFLPCALGWLRFAGDRAAWPVEDAIARDWWLNVLVALLALSIGLFAAILPQKSVALRPAGRPPAPGRDRVLRALVGLAAVYALAMFALGCLRFNAYKPGMLDLGMYDQLHWATFRHRPFYTTVFELPWGISLRQSGYSYNAEHFMPIILATSLPYALWPSPMVLFAIQAISIGAAAIPLYFLTLRLTDRRGLAFLVGAGWLLHPLVQQSNLKDFHPDALEGAFIFAAFWMYEARRPVWYAAALLAAMACKEDVALMFVVAGIFLMVARRDWRWGLATAAAGGVYFFGIAQTIMAAALSDDAGEPVLRHLERFSPLVPEGVEPPQSLGSLAWIVASHPGRIFELLGEVPRQWALLKLFVPLAAVCLIYPPAWLLAAPAVGLHLFSSWTLQARLELYHPATILPWLFIGTIYSLAWLSGREDFRLLRRAEQATESDGESSSPGAPRQAVYRGARFALGAAVLLSFHFFGHLPPGDNFSPGDYKRLDRHDASDELVAQVPPDAAVAVVSELGPRFTRRKDVFLLPDLPDHTEYLALDPYAQTYPFGWAEYQAALRAWLASDEWGVVWHHEEGQFLLKRGAPTDENAAVLAALK